MPNKINDSQMGLPSNGVTSFNVPESKEDVGTFQLRYVYNFYVQDEAQVAASQTDYVDQSGLLSPFSELENGDGTPVSEYVEGSVSSIPAWIDITLPQLRPNQRKIYTYETYRNLGYLYVDTKVQGRNSEASQKIREIWRLYNRKRKKGRSISSLINFEEEFNLGLVDIKLADESLAQDLEAMSILKNRSEDVDGIFGSADFSKASLQKCFTQSIVEENSIFNTEIASKISGMVADKHLAIQLSQGSDGTVKPGETAELVENSVLDLAVSNDLVKSVFVGAMQDPSTTSDLDIAQTFSVALGNQNEGGLDLLLSSENFPEAFIGRNIITLSTTNYVKELKILRKGERARSRNRHEFKLYPLGFLVSRIDMGSSTAKVNSGGLTYFELPKDFALKRKIRDGNVIYGHTYRYIVRRLFAIESLIKISGKSKQYREVTYLVASRPIKPPKDRIQAKYDINPLPPTDLSFRYDFDDRALAIQWEIRPRRNSPPPIDFMIFRRPAVDSPFRLIDTVRTAKITTPQYIQGPADVMMYDPNNSSSGGNRRFYLDYQFKQGVPQIYSIVAVDPHGNVSNYSQQFWVFYDKLNGGLKVKLVSPSGSPLQYPNFFLSRNFGGFARTHVPGDFSNSILTSVGKVSGAENIEVIFAPDVSAISYTEREVQVIDDGRGNTRGGTVITKKSKSLYPTISFKDSTSSSPQSKNSFYFNLINLDNEESDNLQVRIIKGRRQRRRRRRRG